MKIQYFADTDTLLIAFKDRPVTETRDLDENTLLDLDAAGRVVSITLEHASERADVDGVTYQRVRAASAKL
ncbi:MAG: DUF2283 domain-containing protein [Verrucomicrobia bacterium]|jgi:uncharacterized protein YuzE|nr:DUF2283 domain-containing protein [Verrucomicrobiota bacterium]